MSEIIDFHSHILPEIDDGSSSLERSIAMLQEEAKQGIGCVVATPHFYAQHDDPVRFLEKRAASEARLREEMAKHPGLPELRVGAEVYYFGGIADSDIISELTIDEKSFILIEMPLPPWTDRMYRDLEGIWIKRNLVPVIAHIDRYIAPLRTFHIPQRLAQLPVMVQANAEFFLQRSTRSMAMCLLKNECIHLLGSDCHNLSDRKPNLGEAIELIRHRLGQRAIERICDNQQDILGQF